MSGGDNSAQEKTHEATPRKLEQARKKGDLPRSQDAQAAAAYLGLSVAVLIAGSWAMISMGDTLMPFIARPEELSKLFLSPAAQDISGMFLGRIGLAMLPILALPGVAVLLLLIVQRAIVLAPDKIKPKLSRLSLWQNAKQKYGPNGLMEFVKSLVKLSVIGVVLALAVWSESDRLAQYSGIEPRHLPQLLGRQFWNIMTGVLVMSLILAGFDIIWQRFQHKKKMRMSFQEIRDEAKQSEGDPHMRQQRQQRGREIANNRMLNDVPRADVVITNPTHYAVAMKWDRKANGVPVCVAKGVDEIAMAIRVRAMQADVPIHPDPPTARSIHALVDIGRPIEPEHYKAVAAAIVFADKLRAKKREAGRA